MKSSTRAWLKLVVVLVAVAGATLLVFAPFWQNYDRYKEHLPLINKTRLGLDLKGGVHVVLEAQDTPEVKVNDETMKQLIAVLERRVNEFGVAEPIIQRQGARRIIIELAGIENPEQAVRDLVRTAYLEFKDEQGNTVLTGAQLKDALEAKDPQTGEPEVNLTFTSEGAKKFAELTTTHVGRRIAIYLDGQLLQAPVVREPITNGRARITGYSSLQEAHTMAVLLRSGALPLKVTIEEKRSVGPALGADSLERSKQAGVVGVAAILLFMLIYYRVPGLVANFALLIYTLIVLAVFVGMKVTMTLPGIAGFLLSLGIAVDANVIIFERIREELRAGKTLRAAIDAGFKRGFIAVFDANLTTVLAAIVLYFFGTGPIKGFAVTLTIGIVASMFTAITMTRWLLHLVAAAGLVRSPRYFGV